MVKPRTSGAGNKLAQALSQFADTPNKNFKNLSKIALKALRETFGESLKVTSRSDFKNQIISQSVTFSVNSGKFEEILAETALTATVESLEKLDERNIPSKTLHNLATLEALALMGFDIEGTFSESTSVSQPALINPETETAQNSTSPERSPESTCVDPKEPMSPISTSVHNGKGLEYLSDTDDNKPETQSTTTSENKDQSASRTENLNTLLETQSDNSEELKLVSTTIKERIIESMRELDLSDKAILSRLRNSNAKSIHDMTQEEGYRITSWLSKSKADSVSIKKKRETYGGFEQHLPKSESQKEASEDKAPETVEQDSTESTSTKEIVPSTESPDASNEFSKGMSDVVAKTISVYSREASSNDKAKEFAINLIKEITGQEVTEEEIIPSISGLQDNDAKKFRTRLSTMILTEI